MDGRNSWLRNHYEKDKIHHLIVNEVPGNGHEIKIEDTRKGFEESFASGEFYNRQTQDSDHMEKILRFVKIRGRNKESVVCKL